MFDEHEFADRKLLRFWIAALAAVTTPAVGESSSPAGTAASPSGCILASDLVIAEPLELPSFTTLNYRGHSIVTASPGNGTTQETGAWQTAPMNCGVQIGFP